MRIAIASLLLLVGCTSFSRAMRYGEQSSAANRGIRLGYSVLAPRDLRADEELPLVVFLHGGGDSHDAFDRHGISERLLAKMASGEVPRAVILLPDGDLGFWMNWYDESRRYEDWIVDELMQEVAADYHTAECPEHCHVMGVSMGGSGALRFAFHRPDRFSTVTAISGPVMNTDQMIAFVNDPLLGILIPLHRIFGPAAPRERIEEEDLYLRWTSPESTRLRGIVLAWGNADRGAIVEGSRAFSRHLTEHEIPHQAWEYEGGHAWADWAEVIERALVHQLAGDH